MPSRTTTATALAVFLLAGCARRPVVGVVLPETGSAAVYGASIKSGLQLAFSGVARENGAAAVAVDYRDSGSDPARATSAAEALFRAGALLVIGGVTTAEARAMLTVAEKYERVLLSPSASAPELTRGSPYFLRVFPSDELEGVSAADFLARAAGSGAVLIVQEDNDYTRGLLPVVVAELTTRGGRVAAVLRTDEQDWEDRLSRALRARTADAVYVCGYGDAILATLVAVRAARFGGVVCTTSALNAASFLRRAGVLAEGVVFPLVGLDLSSSKEPIRSFVRHYRESYNLLPDTYAAHGYDAALVVLAAFEGSPPRSGDEVRRHLRALRGRRGVTCELTFDERGNVPHVLALHVVHHGVAEPCLGCFAAAADSARPGGKRR